MTLDEAIKHCKEKADSLGCTKCGEDHKQLAEWLEELVEWRKLGVDILTELERKAKNG